MEIKEYKTINKEKVFSLYKSVGWSAYLDNLPSLLEGIRNSLLTLGAYEDNPLVGLIRLIGGGQTIIYIQDLIVRPSYQRKGIGTLLVKEALDRYHDVRQIVLLTDNNPTLEAFYQSFGFKESTSFNCKSFVKFQNKNSYG